MATAGVPFDIRKTLLGHEHTDITAHYSTAGFSRLLEEAEKVRRDVPTLRATMSGKRCPPGAEGVNAPECKRSVLTPSTP